MERSESIKELATALVKAQAAIGPAAKDATNPHFRRKYADLASIWEAARGPLCSHGLAVVQSPELAPDGGTMMLRTTILHESGEWLASCVPLAFDPSSMQSLGSALTYARRYALMAMVGVVASDEDDDGQLAHVPARPASNGHASGNGYPSASQARPPISETQRNYGEGRDRGRGTPTNGKALFGWLKDQEQAHQVGLLKYLNGWAKLQDFPGRMVDWDADQVTLGYAEACRKLQSVPASKGDAYEEALTN